MKEIRFRAWHSQDSNTANKGLYRVLNLPLWGIARMDTPLSLCPFNNPGDRFTDKNFDDYILMQYAGLKDKNGKEIYEGDIIKLDDVVMIYRVFWDRNAFHIQGIKDPEKWTTGLMGYDGAVIGNIYENPELLDVGVADSEPLASTREAT